MRQLFVLALFISLPTQLLAAEPDRKGLDFFEAKIRPMLVKHCYECHSAGAATKKKLKGGLLLDSRDGGRKGGESGAAIVPGKPGQSLLISALNHESLEMPPKGKLPDEIIAHFEKWIEMGAPDPRDGVTVVASSQIDIEAGREHWSFRPLIFPAVPKIKDVKWARTDIDRYIRHEQEAAGVSANNIAAPRTLIRRAYFDLIGLPPKVEDVEKFVAEYSKNPDQAYGKLIDSLLESDHYGERWARHWLDVVRFAESNGYAFDGDRPNAWHYRDFVIRGLNEDMPYDQFVRLQIAGDLLSNVNVKTTDESRRTIEYLAATGFLVAGPYTTQQTQKERERSRYEQLDDIISTIGTSLLGLTVGCSRCHSHKFDPLPQFDYYQMASCFADVGFSNTGVNNKPEEYNKAKAAFDAAHTPLVKARTEYEQKQLPKQFEHWLANRQDTPAPKTTTVKLQSWQHIGPFVGESFEAAFKEAFEPEKAVDLKATYQDGKLKWTPQPTWKDATVHNTLTGTNAANYIYRVIESPEDQALALSLGSDDAIKVWVNGKEVLSKLIGRGAAADQEKLQVPLKKGQNTLLMKIVNGGGPSGFYFSATSLSNTSIEGIADWHHIGPFGASDFNKAFDTVFAPEKDTALDQTYQDGKLKWTPQPDWKDGVAHNDKLTGTNCANYLLRSIESKAHRVLNLSLGSDDGIKLWVNGRQVLTKKVGRNVAKAGQENVTVQLAAGKNEVLMKIVNGGGKTGFYFAASIGQPPKDVATILALAADKRNANQKKRLDDWHKGYDLEWLRLNQAVVRHDTENPKPDLTNVFAARVRGTTYQFGEDTYKVYHLRRGNSDNKEDLATPGFLKVLMTADQQEKRWLAEESDANKLRPGRLGLTDWLTDVDQGAGHLLARVIVNRLWHHHFGRGIVATTSDFGTRGERPSHPELLDWLAAELVRNDWKLKSIHRLIMTSATYMQGSGTTESGEQHDPENLLLWRRGSRRLEAEIIRDALLSVSGTLDSTMFGKGTLDQNSKRRSVYFTVKRSRLIPLLQLFDAPDTMQGIGTREESTVAPQALALLNSAFVRDLATKLAARVRPNAETSIEAAINQAYKIAHSRPATDDEVTAMKTFIADQTKSRQGNAAAETLALRDFCHILLCMNEFVYID